MRKHGRAQVLQAVLQFGLHWIWTFGMASPRKSLSHRVSGVADSGSRAFQGETPRAVRVSAGTSVKRGISEDNRQQDAIR